MSEWKEYKLSDVAEFIDYRGKTPKKISSGVPLITAKIVKNGWIQQPNEFISKEDYLTWMTRGFPNVGDVVLTTEAPLGEVAQIKDASFALAQRIITIRGKSGLIDNGYLKYFLQSSIGQHRLKERETGTTVTGIKSSENCKNILSHFKSYNNMHQYMSEHGKMFVFLGEGTHKIKKKAEQVACETAIQNLSGF
jgi:type I restriction enzyme S subunit